MAKILQITPHPVFPPRGGRRAFFFLRELAKQHEVHAIFPQKSSELIGEKEGYHMPSNVVLHSPLDTPAPPTIFDLLPGRFRSALHYRWLRRSLAGPASSEVLQVWHLIKNACISNQFDIVIFDHIQTLGAAQLVKRWSPGSIRMLNAHNVDCVLYRRLADSAKDPHEQRTQLQLAEQIGRRESTLASEVHGYWACSDEDHAALRSMNQSPVKGFSIPNGIATEVLPFDSRPDKRDSQRILFCGSLNYEPNRRGLNWFTAEVWPHIKNALPGAKLVVVGYGAAPSDFPDLRSDPAVEFIGEVDTVPPWYHNTSLSVVPILEGSGTRVKILEAMALGNPVVSTTVGAEGISVTHQTDIILADQPLSFARAVVEVLSSPSLFNALRHQGRELVDTVYDWSVVGRRLNATVNELIENTPLPR